MKLNENEYIELKKSTSELKQGIISICAILNKHKKGTLYFGFKNDGTLTGQEVSEKTLRDISQSISNHLEPKIFPEISKLSENGTDYIRIDFKGHNDPYFAYGRAYIRVADEDKLLLPAELTQIILQKNIYQSKWDSKISDHLYSECNQEMVSNIISQIKKSGRVNINDKNPEVVLNKLELLKNASLTYAAWHLFSDNQPVELQMAVFNGTDKSVFTDMKHFRGNLFLLLEKAESYIKEKINWRVEFGTDMKRHEIPEIPLNAFREAIVNSFAHRHFNDPQANEIAVFSDRVEIYNPGTFPEGLTPDDFISGNEHSRLRNPKIAEIFFYTRDIDRWGSGFQRINNECVENNVAFSFEVQSNGFLTTFYRQNIKNIKVDLNTIEGGKGDTTGGMKSSDTGGIKTTEQGSIKTKKSGKKNDKVDLIANKEVSLSCNGGIETKKTGGIKDHKGGIEKGQEGGIKHHISILIRGEFIGLPEKQKEVLLFIIGNNKITISEVADKLNIVRSVAQKHIDALKKKGIIKHFGSKKSGYWKILINIE